MGGVEPDTGSEGKPALDIGGDFDRESVGPTANLIEEA